MSDHGKRKCIVYLQSHNEIDEFIKAVNTLNDDYSYDIYIDRIISDDTQKQRNIKLKQFSEYEYYAIMCSVQILDECIDIPKCDSVYITYNSKSKIKNIQRLCRGIRKDADNKNKVAHLYAWCDEYDPMINLIVSLKEADPQIVSKVTITSKNFNRTDKIKRDNRRPKKDRKICN